MIKIRTEAKSPYAYKIRYNEDLRKKLLTKPRKMWYNEEEEKERQEQKMNEMIIGLMFCGVVLIAGLIVSIAETIAKKHREEKPLYEKKGSKRNEHKQTNLYGNRNINCTNNSNRLFIGRIDKHQQQGQ